MKRKLKATEENEEVAENEAKSKKVKSDGDDHNFLSFIEY